MPEFRIGQFLPEQHEYLAATCFMGDSCHRNEERPIGVSMWILGYIDLTTGERSSLRDILIWAPTDEELENDAYKSIFRECEIYRVRCHPPVKYKGMLSGLYVTEIIRERVRNPFLAALIRDYQDSRHLMSDMFGDMLVVDEYDAYSASFDWLGTEIKVEVSGEFTPYTKPLGYLEAFCREAERHDRELRAFAAEKLTEEANRLMGTELSAEEFASGIKMHSIEMYYDGDYYVYYSLGEYEINISGDTKGPQNGYISRSFEY